MEVHKAPSWQSLFTAVSIINVLQVLFFARPVWIIFPPAFLFLIVLFKNKIDRVVEHGGEGR